MSEPPKLILDFLMAWPTLLGFHPLRRNRILGTSSAQSVDKNWRVQLENQLSVSQQDFTEQGGEPVGQVAETEPLLVTQSWLRTRGAGLIFPLPELGWEEFLG